MRKDFVSTVEPEALGSHGRSGWQDTECGSVGSQIIIKISVDVYAAAKLTEKKKKNIRVLSRGILTLTLSEFGTSCLLLSFPDSEMKCNVMVISYAPLFMYKPPSQC